MTAPLHTEPSPASATTPRVSADDVNTACLRTLAHLRRQTGQDVTGQGIPPWEATTVRLGDWVLVGEAWVIDEPAIRWHVWCQAGSRHVGLRVQTNRAPAPPERRPD